MKTYIYRGPTSKSFPKTFRELLEFLNLLADDNIEENIKLFLNKDNIIKDLNLKNYIKVAQEWVPYFDNLYGTHYLVAFFEILKYAGIEIKFNEKEMEELKEVLGSNLTPERYFKIEY